MGAASASFSTNGAQKVRGRTEGSQEKPFITSNRMKWMTHGHLGKTGTAQVNLTV